MNWDWFKDLRDLFFPHLCLACGENKLLGEEILCQTCKRNLPETNMHELKENRFTDRFWGRVYLQTGSAMYLFAKGENVQSLIHQLKYKNKPRIGIKLGERYGKKLKEASLYQDIDVIVPVPLHPRKEHKRGYNQSDQFAIGLSDKMEKPWLRKGLTRITYGESQTRKSRSERFEEVMKAFEVTNPKELEGKHILLVDDVLTTGATLEACATKLLQVPNTKVSMVTIAIGGV